MNCAEIRELLSPATDREVSPEDLKQVEEHLRTCAECAMQSTMLVGMKNLLHKWQGVRPSEEFRTKVWERIKGDPPPGFWSRFTPSVLASIVAGVAAIGLAVVFLVTGSPSVPAGTSTGGASGPPAAPGARPDGAGPGVSTAPVAQVAASTGAVRVTPPGETALLASAGDALAPGYVINVSDKGHADLALTGGFGVRLDRGAEMVFHAGAVCGELRKGRFMLRASGGSALGAGTALSCAATIVRPRSADALASCDRLEDGSARVVVARGEIELASASQTVRLQAGRAADVAPDGTLRQADTEAAPAALEPLLQWGPR